MRGETIFINFFPTTRCNVECAHCIDDACMKNPIDLPVEYIHLLNKQLEKHKWYVEYCATGNGEPLLHPEFGKLLDAMFSYSRNKGMSFLTAGYVEQENQKRRNFLGLLKSNYLRRIHFQLSFNLYADFPERWKAVMKDVLSCDRDLALAANICYSQDNRNKTLEKFNEVFREIALEGEHAENVAHLILHPEHPFCLRNIPEKDGYEFNAPEHISKMFLPERFIYFINGVGGRQFIGVRRSMITKIGRAKSLKEKTFGQCECSDFFQNFDAILHLDPDGNWYSNFNCPKLPAMRLGHITKDSIEDILRRKYYFWSIMTRMLLLDQRPYEAHMPCDVCVKICSEYDLMASAAEEM